MVKQGNAAGSTDIRLALILAFKVIFQILFCSVVETLLLFFSLLTAYWTSLFLLF